MECVWCVCVCVVCVWVCGVFGGTYPLSLHPSRVQKNTHPVGEQTLVCDFLAAFGDDLLRKLIHGGNSQLHGLCVAAEVEKTAQLPRGLEKTFLRTHTKTKRNVCVGGVWCWCVVLVFVVLVGGVGVGVFHAIE